MVLQERERHDGPPLSSLLMVKARADSAPAGEFAEDADRGSGGRTGSG
jgi:hypothetical protein